MLPSTSSVNQPNPGNELPPLHVFDDGRRGFGPLTDRRPAFDLLTGKLTLRERIEQLLGRPADALHLDPLLAAAQGDGSARINPPADLGGSATTALLVNGRWQGDTVTAAAVAELAVGEALVLDDRQIVAAHFKVNEAQWLIDRRFAELPGPTKTRTASARVLLDRPWHILDALPRILPEDLSHENGVHADARVHASAVLDDSHGLVGVAAGATVGPLAVLEGPCWIGRGSVVSAHAHIRKNTVIGDVCKVGGEIGGSIIHPFTNKAHAGYLGDSIVGSWCNLGAGTTVSNLKNTYGEVRVQLDADAPAEGTGRTFQGPILGDFVRTAIGSRLLTGSCLGTACCIAVSGFAPKYLPPLTFLTDAGAEPYDLDSFLKHAAAAMDRRGQRLSDADVAVLRRLAGRRGV